MKKKLILMLIIPLGLIAQKKALVGGTLINGFGNEPIKNSVVIIENEIIKKVGTIDNISIPSDAAFTPNFVKLVSLQVTRALQFLHQRDLVHRDVKPSNILYGEVSTHILQRRCSLQNTNILCRMEK